MDRIEAMSTLLAVVEHGSLSAAGRHLHVPVTTISRRLAALEAQLGTRLLLRSTRRLSLTDPGVAYVESARSILAQVDEAERAAAGEFVAPRGELVVTAPVLFGRLHVLPVVAAFLARFPEISVRLVLTDRNMHLTDDHVDMAVRIGQLADSALVATRVGAMRTVICASPTLIALHGEPADPADLTRFPCVSVDTAMPIAGWQVRRPGSRRLVQVPVVPRLTVSTAEAAAAAAVLGVGITRLLHYQVAQAVQAGELRIVLADFEPEPVPVHLVHAARGNMPLKLRHFLDFAAPLLRDALSPAASSAASRPDRGRIRSRRL